MRNALSTGINSNGSGQGAVTLAGNVGGAVGTGASISINNTATGASGFVISSILGGSVTGITQNSTTSTMTISGANTAAGGFGAVGSTGAVTVTAGTLKMGNAAALGSVNAVTVNGGTFDLNGNSETIAGLNDGGVTTGIVTNSGAAKTLTLGGTGSYSFAGVITATTPANLSLTMSGTGTQTLTGANTYTGTTAVNAGTLQLDFTASGAPATNIISSSSPLSLGGGALQVTGSASGVTQNFASTTFAAGAASGINVNTAGSAATLNLGATLTRNSGATVKFTNTGGNIINAAGGTASTVLTYGVLNGTDFSALDASKNVVPAASVITYTANAAGSSNNASMSGSVTWIDVTTSNPAAGPSAFRLSNTLNTTGLRFNQANSNNIDWVVDANSRNYNLANVLVTANVGAHNVQMNDSSGNVVRLGAGAEFIAHQYNTAGDLIFNGKITQSAGTGAIVTKDGAGRMILANDSNSWAGATNILEGTLQVGNASTTGTISSSSAINDNGNLQFNHSNAITFVNTISGTGSVTQIGAGTVTLTGPNTFTGPTSISSGTLSAGASSALGSTSSVTMNNAGTLLFAAATTDRINNNAAVTLNSGGALNTAGLSEGTAPTGAGGAGGAVGMGALTLSANSTIDFGSGANGSALVFNLLTYTPGNAVTILDWTGAIRSDDGTTTNDRLLFVNNPNLSEAQLSSIQFYDDAHNAFATGAQEISYNGYYEIVPVPEPTTIFGALALVGLVGFRERRRFGVLRRCFC